MQTAAVSTANGLEQSLTKLNTVAAHVASGASADTVDLSSDAVSLIQAKDSFAADIAVLKTADRMESTALDLVG